MLEKIGANSPRISFKNGKYFKKFCTCILYCQDLDQKGRDSLTKIPSIKFNTKNEFNPFNADGLFKFNKPKVDHRKSSVSGFDYNVEEIIEQKPLYDSFDN